MRHITGSCVTAVGKPSYPNTFGKVSCKLLSPRLQVVALRVRLRVPKALARRLRHLPKTQRRSMHCHSFGSQLFLGYLASFGGILLVGRWYFPGFPKVLPHCADHLARNFRFHCQSTVCRLRRLLSWFFDHRDAGRVRGQGLNRYPKR